MARVKRSTAVDAKRRSLSAADALVQAATGGDLERVKKLLIAGADVNALGAMPGDRRKQYKLRPLIAAAAAGHLSVVRLLLKANADLSLTCTDGMTAVDEARVVELGSPKKGRRLVELLQSPPPQRNAPARGRPRVS